MGKLTADDAVVARIVTEMFALTTRSTPRVKSIYHMTTAYALSDYNLDDYVYMLSSSLIVVTTAACG